LNLKDSDNSPIKYRLAQAQSSLEDAKYLLDGNRSPEGVINRAYYAMFYAALALFEKIGKSSSKHTGVISIFDTKFVLKKIFPNNYRKTCIKHLNYAKEQITKWWILFPKRN